MAHWRCGEQRWTHALVTDDGLCPIIIDTGIGKSLSNPSPEALILFAMVEGRSCLCIVLMFPDGQIANSLK